MCSSGGEIWMPAKPLGPRKRSHSWAMSVHFHSNRWTKTVRGPDAGATAPEGVAGAGEVACVVDGAGAADVACVVDVAGAEVVVAAAGVAEAAGVPDADGVGGVSGPHPSTPTTVRMNARTREKVRRARNANRGMCSPP